MNGTDELISNVYKSIDREEWDQLGIYFHENIVYDRPGYQSMQGYSEVSEFYKRSRLVSKGVHTVIKLVTQGEYCFYSGMFEGTLKNGKDVQLEFADYFEIADNKVIYRKTYFYTPMV